MIKNYLDYLKELYKQLKESEEQNVRDRVNKPQDKQKIYKMVLGNKKEKQFHK